MGFNLETDSCPMPVGLGIGKVVPARGAAFHIFVEPQFTILDLGAEQAKPRILSGLNTQFAKK